MNKARARRPGATRSASPRDAQYNAKPSTTNPISALRVDFTSTAIFLSGSEYSTQREDRRDGIADVGIASPDGAFGGDDGRYTADGRPDSQQRSELAGQAEKVRCGQDDPTGQRHIDQDLHQRDTAQLDHIAENETYAKSDNPDLQPEFIGLDAGAEDPVQANGVGDEQAEDDRPQHVLDIRHPPMLVMRKRIPPDLGIFAKQADPDQEQDPRHVLQNVAAGEARLVSGLRLLGND